MSRRFRPVDPDGLAGLLAGLIAKQPGTVRVAVDGPACARPHELAQALAEPLRALGRPFAHVRADTFWRDASLRFEHGRQDVDAFLTWLDAGALRREVLDPIVAAARFLPSLRDPVTNRSTREPPRTAETGTVLAVSGDLLLGLALPFDTAIHLAMTPAARERRTDPALAWTLPAFDRYDAEVAPAEHADVVVRWDDPRHPAISVSGAPEKQPGQSSRANQRSTR